MLKAWRSRSKIKYLQAIPSRMPRDFMTDYACACHFTPGIRVRVAYWELKRQLLTATTLKRLTNDCTDHTGPRLADRLR